MKETYLQNIQLSSQIIVFDQDNHQGQLIITNKHATLGVVFKIKATKLNIIQVKPAKGHIKPQNKITIHFKLTAQMSLAQMETTQKNDKFLIQFLNIPNQDATRQQVQSIWSAYKNNTANLQHGYGCYRVLMNLTGKRFANSNVRSQVNSKMFKTVVKTSKALSNQQENKANDQELSKKYTELKLKQQDLKNKRQNLFKPTSTQIKKGSKIKSSIVLIIFFFLAFAAGNFVRSSMVKVKTPQKTKQTQKSFFSSLFN